MLHSGVNILKAFQVAGAQSLDPKLQRASKAIVDDLKKGSQVAEAMRDQAESFPDLMIDLVDVAEQTGSLPEVLVALANHYDNLVRLRRSFLGAIAWPIFQLLAAILIVAGLILILGWIAGNKADQPDMLGMGLRGPTGAMIWLGCCFGTAIALFVGYKMLTRGLSGQTFVHSLLLRVPVVGGCLRSFAVARFSWAFALTQQSGMSIEPSLEASLKATGNGAFAASIPQTVAMVREGEDLTTTLNATGLYPREYLELVRVGETTGTVPEALERISPQLEDQARRSLSAMTAVLAWLIWALVAAMIIFIIFRVFMNYVALLNDLSRGI
ncbi:MAG: type II secretion system F family protein [Planctomycetes bacterium]|nr:type II secretion system F family protein [Planctomycetota bacterium]